RGPSMYPASNTAPGFVLRLLKDVASSYLRHSPYNLLQGTFSGKQEIFPHPTAEPGVHRALYQMGSIVAVKWRARRRSSAPAGLLRLCRYFFPLQPPQDAKYLVEIRLLAEMIDLAKDDRPFFIDDEDRALSYPRDRRPQAEHTVALSDLAMGIEIAA